MIRSLRVNPCGKINQCAASIIERGGRAELRKLTTHDDGGMTPWVALMAWQTYERPAFVEVRSLLGFAQGLGLDEFETWEIHQAVAFEMAANEANRDARTAEVRKRMLAAAREV